MVAIRTSANNMQEKKIPKASIYCSSQFTTIQAEPQSLVITITGSIYCQKKKVNFYKLRGKNATKANPTETQKSYNNGIFH